MSNFKFMSNKSIRLEPTGWKGSALTYKMVYDQILIRYGETMARKLDPARNCRTYRDWLYYGFQVRQGEKALKSVVYIPIEKDGVITDVLRRQVSLFYFNQLERIIS